MARLTTSLCDKLIAAGVPDRRNKKGEPISTVKHPDGAGLYLVVGRGRCYWTAQFRSGTSWSSKGIGGYPEFGPKQARERLKHWQVTGSLPGEPPRTAKLHKDTGKDTGLLFPEAVEAWLIARAHAWRSPRAATQRRSGLINLVPLATSSVASITQDDVLTALEGQTPRQYAEKRRWLADFFSHAKAQKWRAADSANPSRFDADIRAGFPKVVKNKKHHAALAHADLPAIMKKLGQSEACRALAFTILTAVRTGDTEGATWAQISKDDVWTIPVAKNGKALRVPLTTAALKLLGERPKKPTTPLFDLKSNAMLDCLKGHRPDATVHGMRSTFRDWVGETRHADKVLAEMALGHKVGSDVESAYARSDLLKLRRELMNARAEFCVSH
jgi:integrase